MSCKTSHAGHMSAKASEKKKKKNIEQNNALDMDVGLQLTGFSFLAKQKEKLTTVLQLGRF